MELTPGCTEIAVWTGKTKRAPQNQRQKKIAKSEATFCDLKSTSTPNTTPHTNTYSVHDLRPLIAYIADPNLNTQKQTLKWDKRTHVLVDWLLRVITDKKTHVWGASVAFRRKWSYPWRDPLGVTKGMYRGEEKHCCSVEPINNPSLHTLPSKVCEYTGRT